MHHGHEVHQYRLALTAHDAYVERYPYSPRVMEIKVNKQDITLELARHGEANFDEVIVLGSSFMAVHRDAPPKYLAHANLLIAEAIMESQRDYEQVKDITQYIISDYGNGKADEIMGSVYRLQAYAQYFSGDLPSALDTWNRFITNGLTNPEYNSFLRVEENKAAAHFWRGYINWKLGNTTVASSDFNLVLQNHTGTDWAYYSNQALINMAN